MGEVLTDGVCFDTSLARKELRMVGLTIPHSLRRSAWAIRATTAGVASLSLLAVVVYVADVNPAAHACAGAQALETGVVRFYGVVVIVSGWVRGLRGRLLLVHSFTSFICGPGSGVCHHPRGHFFVFDYSVLLL